MAHGPHFNSMRARHERVYGPVSDEAFAAWVQANIDELEENWGPERDPDLSIDPDSIAYGDENAEHRTLGWNS